MTRTNAGAASVMTFLGVEIWAIIGFMLGAYAVVANDAIQTLGTFLSSNAQRPWWVLWLFASLIITAVIVTGYVQSGGDIAYDRLDKLRYPEGGMQWWHSIPPLALLILTRYGIPVSTTFMVLALFSLTGDADAQEVLPSMIIKSGLGYVVAFLAGASVYFIVAKPLETWVHRSKGADIPGYWTVLQWGSTGFLWSQWLIQDLANIFVFLPRSYETLEDGTINVTFEPGLLAFALVVMVGLHAIVFQNRGGEIQKIVTSKTNTVDVRAATLVDFIYALILLFFKEISNIPMSTTWVFLGLLAGRELMIAWMAGLRDKNEALFDVLTDIVRAFIGLVVSIILAVVFQYIATGRLPEALAGLL